MKKIYTAIGTLALCALTAMPAAAEEIEATFLVATLSSGATESMMLPNDSSSVGPILRHKEALFVINGNVYATSDIVSLRFEKRMIDAISTVATAPSALNVYDLQGRRVIQGDKVTGLQGNNNCQLSIINYQLPKGIYIIGGKKVVIR